jgi:hypothetical protein
MTFAEDSHGSSAVLALLSKHVVSVRQPLYECCSGVRPIIYCHDATTAINEKNNRCFATPDAALLVLSLRVNCHVLRGSCIRD